jgi:hypothetical protein
MADSVTKKWEKARPYAVEALASALVLAVMLLGFGPRKVMLWVLAKKTDLTVFAGIAAAISGAIFAAYFGVLSTDFGKRLRLAHAASEYAAAFAFPLLVFLTEAFILTSISNENQWALLVSAGFMLVYSLLNCYTMIKNVIDLVKVWQDVENARATGKP